MGKSCNMGENHPKFIDLKGKIFGKLTVLEYYPKQHKKRITWLWKCLCECGNYTFTRTKEFMKPKPVQSCKSCGYKRMGKTNTLPNHHNLKNQVFLCYKRNAKNRNYSFELTFEQVCSIIDKKCHYCKDLPSEPYSEKERNTTHIPFKRNGIDRVDNSLGYTINNVVTCCKKCNIAKASLTYKEFLTLIEKIYNNLIKLSSTTIPKGSTQ